MAATAMPVAVLALQTLLGVGVCCRQHRLVQLCGRQVGSSNHQMVSANDTSSTAAAAAAAAAALTVTPAAWFTVS
jgi:ABC-type sulfate transport system permease component